ncbi:hypothetical protein AYY16_08895 [Morganella psychrotolerans]|nr:hypothetical protein AYY16_08895 [Morganella psychrotolerans]
MCSLLRSAMPQGICKRLSCCAVFKASLLHSESDAAAQTTLSSRDIPLTKSVMPLTPPSASDK